MNYDPSQLPPSTVGDETDYDGGDRTGKYLPRLRIYTGTAGAIQSGLVLPGEFGSEKRKDDVTSLGKSTDIQVFMRKRMALDMTNSGKPVRHYDPKSDGYKAVKALVDNKNKSCQEGTLFLVYTRELGWHEFFCSAPSWAEDVSTELTKYLPVSAKDVERAAAAGKVLVEQGPQLATLTSELVGKTVKWHVPVVTPCTTPFVNAPLLDSVIRECTRFANAKGGADEGEKVGEGSERVR